MIDLIEFEEDFEPVKFNHNLPIDLVQVTGRDVKHTRIEPDDYSPRAHSYPEILVRKLPFLPSNSLLKAPENLREKNALKPNMRLFLCNIALPTPEGFVPGPIEEFGLLGTGKKQSTKYLGIPDAIHLKKVVTRINQLNCDMIRQGDLTFDLRNKNMKAKDIENVLRFLADRCGALQMLNNTDTPTSSVGGRPPQEYLVLWGESDFFQPKKQEE